MKDTHGNLRTPTRSAWAFYSTIMMAVPGISATAFATVVTYTVPAGVPTNADYSVRVRQSGGTWQNLPICNVKVNQWHLSNASMVNFSFSGTIDMEVTYNAGAISDFEVRPSWMVGSVARTGNVITFTTSQDDTFPRKFVVMVNKSGGDNYYDKCLHILGNPLEVNPPRETDTNVQVVEPGQTPVPLNSGKDTYYFKPGLHTDHTGPWAEIDLGQSYAVDKITLVQRDFSQTFKVWVRNGLADNYTLAYNGMSNTFSGTIAQSFPAVTGRYVKIAFFANNNDGNRYKCHINEFKVYVGASANLAQGKYRVGSHSTMSTIVDGNDNGGTSFPTSGWPNRNMTGESVTDRFWFTAANEKVYIAGGAVLRGGVYSENLNGTMMTGRGIIDGSQSYHAGQENYINRVNPYVAFQGSGVTLEGYTVMDPPGWTCFFNCGNSTLKNVNQFSSEGNGDGFNLGGTGGTVASGLFIRACDDLVGYPSGTFTMKNSCLWGDKAHLFFLTGGSGQKFYNIDVLNSHEDLGEYQGVIVCQNANISNVLFENIRIWPFRDPAGSVVMWLTAVLSTGWSNPGGNISNITIRNLSYLGAGERQSIIEGSVSGVNIINYSRPGIPCVTNAAQGNITVRSGASAPTFACVATIRRYGGEPSGAVSHLVTFAHGAITIACAGRHTISIANLSGAIVKRFGGSGNRSYALNDARLGAGTYYVKVTAGGMETCERIVIR